MKRSIVTIPFSVAVVAFLIYASASSASGWHFGVESFFHSQFKLLPVYAVFFLLNSWLGTFSSAILVSLGLALLGAISKIKEVNTGEPLGFYDLMASGQAKHLASYLEVDLIVLGVIFTAFALFSVVSRCRSLKMDRTFFRVWPGIIGCFLSAICLYQHIIESDITRQKISYHLSKYFHLEYVGWHMKMDVVKNGLPFHLIFTSKKFEVKKSSLQELREFESHLNDYKDNSSLSFRSELPKKIIYVLCEACWDTYPEGQSVFSSLLKDGFYQTNMVAPVYGGGTANTEFEVLTGLPSVKLSGYVYQEYKEDIKSDAITVPSEFKRLGYRTISLHNFYRNFYHRDKIYPKFGFDRFIDIEEMNYTGGAHFPPDNILFNSIKENLGNASERVFVSAITVSTHGPYTENGDGGYVDYQNKLEKTVKEIKSFVEYLDSHKINYLMVLYGDHKPSMSKYFHDQKIFPKHFFLRTGNHNKDFVFHPMDSSEQNIIGGVPVLIKIAGEVQNAENLAMQLKDKPIFCLSPSINSWLGADIDPSFAMMAAKCEHPSKNYGEYKFFHPDQLYYRNLFATRGSANFADARLSAPLAQ